MRKRLLVAAALAAAAVLAAGPAQSSREASNDSNLASARGFALGAEARGLEQGPLFGVLTGAKEVSADGRKRAGDPDGRGSASAIIDSGKLCFGIAVKKIGQPTAAHIHEGSPKVAGPVVLPLTAPSTVPGAVAGCVPISQALADAILKNPRKYYWNVHTTDFPGGAIRGQVFERTR